MYRGAYIRPYTSSDDKSHTMAIVYCQTTPDHITCCGKKQRHAAECGEDSFLLFQEKENRIRENRKCQENPEFIGNFIVKNNKHPKI